MYCSTHFQKCNPFIHWKTKFSPYSQKGAPALRPGTKKLFSLLTLFLAVWLSARLLLPLFSPFLMGLALALAAEPMVGFLHRRAHVPRAVSAGIGVTMAFAVLAMLLLTLCAFLVRELKALAGVLPDLEQAAASGLSLVQSWLLDLTAHTPRAIQPLLRENVTTLLSDGTALLDKTARYLLSFAGNLLSHIPDSALSLGTAVISGYMISAKLPKLRRWLRNRLPKERLRHLLDAGKRIKTAVFGWLTAQCKLMAVTFSLLAAGFLLLRIPHPLLWAAGISLVDAFPILGTGTVLIPWAFFSFLQGNTPRAIGIAGIYALITLTRSALEPRLLGRHLGMDPLITLMSLYAGYKLWGITGMLLAPLLTVIALQLTPQKEV